MKRRSLVITAALTVLVALWPAWVQADRRTQAPGALKTWKRSVAAIGQIVRVHAEGTLALRSGSTHEAMTYTSDCDWSGEEGRLFLHIQAGPGGSIDVLSIGTDQWMRSSGSGNTWQPVTSATLTDTFLAVFLPEAILQSRSVAGLGIGAGLEGLEQVRTTDMRNLGASAVSGNPTWHLRLRWKHNHQHLALNVYVDQTSGLWLRKTTRATGPGSSEVLVIDTRYSRFNDPMTINPPPAVQPGDNTPPHFTWPGGLAIDPGGSVYVANAGEHSIVTLSPDGKVKSTMLLDLHDPAQSTEPDDVAVDAQGNLYIAFWMHNLLLKLDPAGKELARFDLPAMASSVELDNEGNVWIVTVAGDVVQFSPAGDQLASWKGDFGETPEHFATPDLAFDAGDHLYITDANHHRIQEYSSDGKLLARWGQKGTGLGQFQTPLKIAIDPKGYVYVIDLAADGKTGRVEKLTLDGKALLAWKTGPLSDTDASDGIAVDAAGNVYVAGDHQIQKFSPTGQLLITWG